MALEKQAGNVKESEDFIFREEEPVQGFLVECAPQNRYGVVVLLNISSPPLN